MILERSVEDASVGGSNLVKKLQPQSRLLGLVPFERRFYVSIASEIREKAVGFHLDLESAFEVSARRSSTSNAECPREGFSR